MVASLSTPRASSRTWMSIFVESSCMNTASTTQISLFEKTPQLVNTIIVCVWLISRWPDRCRRWKPRLSAMSLLLQQVWLGRHWGVWSKCPNTRLGCCQVQQWMRQGSLAAASLVWTLTTSFTKFGNIWTLFEFSRRSVEVWHSQLRSCSTLEMPDFSDALILRRSSSVRDVVWVSFPFVSSLLCYGVFESNSQCHLIHRTLEQQFKAALVWVLLQSLPSILSPPFLFLTLNSYL